MNVTLAPRQLLEICRACKASGQWRGEQSRSFATMTGVEKGRRRRREEPLKTLRIIQALFYLLVVSLIHGPPIRLASLSEMDLGAMAVCCQTSTESPERMAVWREPLWVSAKLPAHKTIRDSERGESYSVSRKSYQYLTKLLKRLIFCEGQR